MAETNSLRNRVLILLAILGPGIIAATVGNDASGITTYSIVGAHFGYGLLWTLVPMLITLAVVQEMATRMGAVTGQGLADLIRENFGVRITFFLMVGLVIANMSTTIAEFSGISAASSLLGIPPAISVVLAAGLILFVMLRANYKTIEKVFLFMVLFYFAYVVSGFIAKPDWSEVGKALVIPHLEFSKGYLVLLIGVIGTTITPWMQFYLQSSVVDKGLHEKDLKYARIDSLIGVFIAVAIAFFIIIATSATLHKAGVNVETASEAALALKPIAGEFATILFGVGLLAAGLFGAAILPLATSFYICEGLGLESGVNKRFSDAKVFYIILIVIVVIGALVPLLPGVHLIKLMVASQVINGIILPVILITMIKLINDKRVMGEHTNPLWYNIIVWTFAIGIIVATLALVFTTLFPV